MKQNKGITLITLVMYIIITLIVLGILGMLSRNFRSNLNNVNSKTVQEVEFDKLNVQLLKETKAEENFIDTETATSTSITFANGNVYTFNETDKAVYLNDKIKIAESITTCVFEIEETDTEQMLKVRTLIGDKGQITEYVINKKESILPGERATRNSKYVIDDKTAWIPKGFTVSGIEEEQTIDGGLVIYDIPEGTTPDWTDPDSVKTAYNQFVWIPVEVTASDTETNIAAFTRSKWIANATTGGERTTGLSTSYTEPNETNDTADKTGIANQIENLTKSIYKYGGFYIGRYEVGSETERNESSGVTKVGIKQDMYPYIYVKWGDSMSEIGTTGAVYLSNSLYNTDEYGATSMLCTGACWDSMLDFIKDSEHSVIDSTKWGNCKVSEMFEVNRGAYAFYDSSSGTLGNFNNVESKYSKTKDTPILLTTGATERNAVKNIYDIAGNCSEWTTESYSSGMRVSRGGDCGGDSNYLACLRNCSNPMFNIFNFRGFRSALYVSL